MTDARMATWPSGKAEACKAFTPGSNPGVASNFDNRLAKAKRTYADMAQLVEHHLAKVGVAGSNPVVRSRISNDPVDRLGRFLYHKSLAYPEKAAIMGLRQTLALSCFRVGEKNHVGMEAFAQRVQNARYQQPR